MGWFDDQIENRKKMERELLADSFEDIARSIVGHGQSTSIKEGADVSNAITNLLAYFGVKEKEIPPKLTSLQDKLDFLLSSSGILYREVTLEAGWHSDATGALITTTDDDGAVVAVLPSAMGYYRYYDPRTGQTRRVDASEEKKLAKKALCFYRPFPQRKIALKDLFAYMWSCLNFWDFISFGIAAAAITLVGMLIPKLNQILMGDVISSGSYRLLFAVMSFMLFATLSTVLLSSVRSLLLSRITTKLNINVQAAAMMRVLSLPADFFKSYTSGELNQYLSYLNSICDTLSNSILSAGITGLFSLVYLTQIFNYAPSLVLPSLLVTIITLVLSLASSFIQIKINREYMKASAKEKGLVYNLIAGIQKIRLSGAENRAFSKWAVLYSKASRLVYQPPLLVELSPVITTAVSLLGTGMMYYISVKNGVSVADYYAFNSAYAYISSSFTVLASVALAAASVKPTLDVARPLLDAQPELTDGLETVSSLSGSVELSHVTFRYEKDGPNILDDLSISIPPHQYVAIVGRSGCGKSTLMRLLLGFETPNKGAIYYDRRDTRHLDMGSVRRHIGTVMQDGKIFSGSIFENICISAPTLTLAEAWEAAEIAGIADDIRAMPMGMNTMLQEGFGGISGGQRQRIMIARAVAPKPKLLMFDEATSALDNITQKQVSDALDGMKCTRIVIAHRLSTIRHCDRILVLDGGKIIEDGTYEQLIAKNGFFAELVERQRIDIDE